MSLSGALNNATSGLAVTARSASLISSNIANALTEGYGRRELVLSSDVITSSGGVRSEGVLRHSDRVLMHERRLSDAQAGQSDTLAAHAARMEDLIGSPLDGDSLTARLDAFDSALILAAGDPSSGQRLDSVARTASQLVQKLNSASSGVQQARRQAETDIARMAQDLEAGLQSIADINVRISRMLSTGGDSSALVDQRQQEIDRLAGLVPLRVIERDRGTVALYSTGGQILLDGKPPTIGFLRGNEIAPQMTLAGGHLSGMTINGHDVATGPDGPLAGGALEAAFRIRDIEAPALQARLDGVARDLAERFGPGGPDSSLMPGDAGPFTDMGLPVTATDETGLADRLRLNARLAPEANATWRWRDGLNAATSGPVGDGTLLSGLRDRLSERIGAGSSALRPAPLPISAHVAELASAVADTRVDLQREQEFTARTRLALREQELAKGVDTDAELQHLMRVEQAFAANAQVVRAVDDLMQILLQR